MVKLSFYGAAGEVTGSNFLIETDQHKYVVDCGLFQGGETFPEANAEAFGYEPAKVEAAVVTHAHLDHIGRIPKLVHDGFQGPIYCTQATAELGSLVLKDAFGIMDEKSYRNNTAPLYEQVDLKRALAHMKPAEYRKPTPLGGNDSVTLYDAGHILGSASVCVEADGKKIVFSGDIGHAPSPLLPKPDVPPQADVVVIEATYGGQKRPQPADRLEVLKEALDWVVANRGVLLIPAFSIERSQELLYLFDMLFKHHQLPRIPIYLDSPLAIEALEVFERHQELFNQSVQQERKTDSDIFSFKGLALASTVEDSKDINHTPPPKVIIAGSGMMVGGRISHHLKHHLGQANTYLLVIGFQAPGTLGSRILQGGTVEVMREHIPIKAKVVNCGSFSGHADDTELLNWLHQIELNDQAHIFIVHSEKDRAQLFAEEVRKQLPRVHVEAATHGESVEI